MADSSKDTQTGMVMVIIAVFFLMSGMGLLEHQVLDEGLSTLIAFVLVACGTYLIAKAK
jgi:multisubunit Na+/H+ antiporter MnhG subunit